MRFLWKRSGKLKPSPQEIGARCPGCRCELPLTYEQRLLLADGGPAWPFCPVCARIVSADAFTRADTGVRIEAAAERVSQKPIASLWQPELYLRGSVAPALFILIVNDSYSLTDFL